MMPRMNLGDLEDLPRRILSDRQHALPPQGQILLVLRYVNSVTYTRNMRRAGRTASVEKKPRTMRFPMVTTSLPHGGLPQKSATVMRRSGT